MCAAGFWVVWARGGGHGVERTHFKQSAGVFRSSLEARIATSRDVMEMEHTIVCVVSVLWSICNDNNGNLWSTHHCATL